MPRKKTEKTATPETFAKSALHLAIPGEKITALSEYIPPKKRKNKNQDKTQQDHTCNPLSATPPAEKKLTPRRRNRPITDEQKELILQNIASGSSLSEICRNFDITQAAVYEEITINREFAENYARARERQADFYADEIIDLADSCPATQEDVQKARLQIDARKWACGKLHPRKYSDKAQIELTGAGGGAVAVAAATINLADIAQLREKLRGCVDIDDTETEGYTE